MTRTGTEAIWWWCSRSSFIPKGCRLWGRGCIWRTAVWEGLMLITGFGGTDKWCLCRLPDCQLKHLYPCKHGIVISTTLMACWTMTGPFHASVISHLDITLLQFPTSPSQNQTPGGMIASQGSDCKYPTCHNEWSKLTSHCPNLLVRALTCQKHISLWI